MKTAECFRTTMSSELIVLASDAGEQLLSEASQLTGCYQTLIHGIFAKQVGDSTCGIASAALVVNAAHLGQNRPPVASPIPAGHPEVAVARGELRFSEQSMLNSPVTNSVVSKDIVNKDGTTLKNVHDVLVAHGYGAVLHHASDRTVAEFREDAIDALSRSDSSKGIIVNYHMGVLGQGLDLGHHSPLAAYHREGDRFLILDTWPATQECWPTAEKLFEAMNTVDAGTGKTRGYCLFYLP